MKYLIIFCLFICAFLQQHNQLNQHIRTRYNNTSKGHGHNHYLKNSKKIEDFVNKFKAEDLSKAFNQLINWDETNNFLPYSLKIIFKGISSVLESFMNNLKI